jgi:hypothetical protein
MAGIDMMGHLLLQRGSNNINVTKVPQNGTKQAELHL